MKLKPVEPICGNVMSSVGLVTNRATDDVDSASDRKMFVGAQTAVSGLQVFQNELYVSYQGIENVKRFDIYVSNIYYICRICFSLAVFEISSDET